MVSQQSGCRTVNQLIPYFVVFWPELVTAENQPLHTAVDLWLSGLTKNPDSPCLGFRALVSTNPVKFSETYTWQTYREIDQRRRNLGSTIHEWFSSGRLIKAEGGYECVGIWSPNRPGASAPLPPQEETRY